MLDAIGAEDEMGEGFVGDDLLAGMAGLSQVDGRGRVFGGGVLVALEGEVRNRPVAVSPPGAPPFGASTRRVAADEIVRQFARVLEKRRRP